MKTKTFFVTAFLCLFFAATAFSAEKTVVAGDLGEKLDKFMTEQEEDDFSGALLVAKSGKIILAKGYGYADRENKIKISPTTVFDIGSLTKQFTAAAIMKLQEQDKLSTGDKITKYFENVPTDKAEITLHHLLTHGAGFPGGLGYDYAKVELDAFLKLAFDAPLKFKPGSGYQYSNVGFALLAAIVEKASGQPYDIFTRANLFKPAGMERTGYRIPEKFHGDVAAGYRGGEKWGKPNEKPWREHGPYWHLHGNGGTLSNVYDMYKWHLALLGDDILSPVSKQKMYAPHNPEGPGGQSFYGYGWSIVKTPRGGKLITHNGGNPYFANDFLRYIDDDVVIMISSNNGDKPATRLSRKIARIIFTGELPQPRRDMTATLEDSEQGKRAAAFLRNLAASDADLRAFITENFAADVLERMGVDGIMEAVAPDRKFMRDGALRYAFQAGRNAMEVFAENSNSGEWLKFDLNFEKEAPHGISGLGINYVDPPNPKSAKKTTSRGGASGKDWGLPGSPTGRRGSEFLTAIYSGKEADLKKFVEDSFDAEFARQFPMSEHLAILGQTHDELGDFEITAVTKTGPYRCKLKLKSGKNGVVMAVDLELSADPPHGIVGIQIAPKN